MSDILTGFNMQGNDPIDDRIVSKSILETLEEYLKRVPVQKRYYGLTFFALDKDNKLRQYTFQTSLIEPTIDDSDDRLDKLQENIDNVDKDLQEHKNDKSIHKTSEEIRSEIVEEDIPDSIARVQWVIQSIGVAIENIVAGASTDYDTLKKVQTKIEELRSEMESQLYGDDGSGIFKTLEQVLDFLNEYKDFIVDIPNNFVSKKDIIDNLTTDDANKVLSARQGKILSETLTNYFDSAMQSIRSETDRATNAENRIEAKLDKEIDRSIKEDQRIDSKLDSEINRSTTEDDRLDKKIDAETDRAESEESRIETKLDNEITRSANKDTEHDNRLTALEGETHEQNTDLGTTNSTFQLKYNTGNKIKHESDAISVRNAADTDYVNFIAKNATFKGDLLVEGQSFVTEAETVEIKDNLLLLNKGEVGSGVTKGIAGLEIDRGTEPNYQIIFDESDNRFKAGEIGDIQCLALRDGDNSMVNGMFTSWDSSTKRLKTTNIIPSDQKISFGDNGDIELKYSVSKMGEVLTATTPVLNIGRKSSNYPHIEFGFPSNYAVIYTDAINGIYLQNQVLGRTFKRATDLSEVLYHADIVNNLTSGGINKVLSAEQGKILKLALDDTNTEIENVKGSYLPLSGGEMTGNIILPTGTSIKGKVSDSSVNLLTLSSGGVTQLGHSGNSINLITGNNNLKHNRADVEYIIHDTYNLPDPAKLSANQTFTGENNFTAGKFNVKSDKSTFSINDVGGMRMYYDYADDETGISRYLDFYTKTSSDTNYTRKGIFGLYISKSTPNSDYAYIGTGDVGAANAQYKFFPAALYVPEAFYLRTITTNRQLLHINPDARKLEFGGYAFSTWIFSNNTDLFHSKYTDSNTHVEYKIWDASNIAKPVSYNEGAANAVTTIYQRNLGVNGSQWTFLSYTNASTTNIYAPTTAGTSGQVLQSQGAGKAPTWVNFSGGGVQLSDNNTWTGLNTFQGGLKTSDGTNSYDVWANDILTNPVKYTLNSTGTGYALSFYSKTAGWKEIDTLTTKYLTSATVKSINAGGDGYIGIGSNAYASAAIAEINTNSIFFKGLLSTVLSTNSDGKLEYGSSSNYAGFNSSNIRITYPIISSSGGSGGGGGGTTDPSEGGLTIGYYPANTKSKVTERAKIYCTTANLYLKDLAKNTQLDFDTDGLYVTTGSTSKVRLATLNDVSGGGGSSVSLDGNNTWTGTNTFKSTVQMQSEDLTDAEGTQTCGYDIQMTDLARTVNFKLEGHLDRDPIFKVGTYNFQPVSPYATLTVDGGLFRFQSDGSLSTKISGTYYEFWNKNNLTNAVKAVQDSIGYNLSFYNGTRWIEPDTLAINELNPRGSNTIADGGSGYVGLYDSAYASAEIASITTKEIIPFDGKSMSSASTGTSTLGSSSNFFKAAYVGEVYTNTLRSTKISTQIGPDLGATVEITETGIYFTNAPGTRYKLTMEQVS